MLRYLSLRFGKQWNQRHKNISIEGHNMELHELHDVTKEKEISNLLVLLPPKQAERSDLSRGYRLNAMKHILSAPCI